MNSNYKGKIEEILLDLGYRKMLVGFLHKIDFNAWKNALVILDTQKFEQFYKNIYFFLLALNALSTPSMSQVKKQARKHVKNVLIPLEEIETTNHLCF